MTAPAGGWLEVALSAVLNGFFLGGMFRMACLQVQGRRIDVGDLFGIRDVLPQLALGSAMVGLGCFFAAFCFVIPAFILAGVWMFAIPLIVDGRLPAPEAIARSWHALKGQWLMATLFFLAANFVTYLGACCFCVGVLFTMPLYCLSVAVLYRDFFLGKVAPDLATPHAPDPYF